MSGMRRLGVVTAGAMVVAALAAGSGAEAQCVPVAECADGRPAVSVAAVGTPGSAAAAAVDAARGLSPDEALWYQHVQTLANPMFDGRVPGTRGGALAEEYLEFFFREEGLAPVFSTAGEQERSYRQTVDIAGAPVAGFQTAGALAVAGWPLKAGRDFVVTANSPDDEVAAPVTFVGYAIERGEDGYRSFAPDADLEGRVALMMRLEPLDHHGRPRWGSSPGPHSSLRAKFEAVVRRGAAGILLVNPPGAAVPLPELDPLPPAVGFGCTALNRVPTMMITLEAADDLLRRANAGCDLMTLRRRADDGLVQTLDLADRLEVTLRTNVERTSIRTANVAGALVGSGRLADQWIVIGAHHDHVGHGLGGVRPEHAGRRHPGADDNASGVAAMLVLARRLAREYATAAPTVHLRSILFVGFAAEETGMNGSRRFVEHPPVPLERITMMLNLDMVGRLRRDTVFLQGLGTAKELPGMVGWLVQQDDLRVVTETNVAGSDHVPFVNAGVPALFAMTGGHDELHTPADRAATMNPRGAIRVADLMQSVVLEVAGWPHELTFVAQETGGAVSCSSPFGSGEGEAFPPVGCGAAARGGG